MDFRNAAIFLSSLKSYPLSLAKKVGCEAAVMWYDLFLRFGECSFIRYDGASLGILQGEKVFDNLLFQGYIAKSEDKFILIFDKILDVADGASMRQEIKPPFCDPRFLQALSEHELILKKKGKTYTKKELYERFNGKDLEDSIRALVIANQNKYVTFYFKDDAGLQKDSSGSAKRVQDSGRSGLSHGGSKNNESGQSSYRPRVAGSPRLEVPDV